MDFNKRLDCAALEADRPRNCFGTSLFLLGAIDREKYVSIKEFMRYLSQQHTSEPTPRCLVTFRYGDEIWHADVVNSLNPLHITDRMGDGSLRYNHPIYTTAGTAEFYVA